MFEKNNRALFGVLLIIIGIYMLINPGMAGTGNISCLMLGVALLLLYFCKQKFWALILGSFFFELGLFRVLMGNGARTALLPAVLFLFIPGTVFMTLFLTKNKQGLLIPASILLWTGFGLACKTCFSFARGGSMMTLCIGMAFITIYLLGHMKNSRRYLVLGLIICFFGGYPLISPFVSRLISLDRIGWIAVIVLVSVLFLKARKNRRAKEHKCGDMSE